MINPAFLGLFTFMAVGSLLVAFLTKTHRGRNILIFILGSVVLFYLVAILVHVVGLFE